MLPKIYKFPTGETICYHRRKLKNASAVQAGFMCGHMYANNGVPHILEHMLAVETNKRNHDQIRDDFQKIANMNAHTDNYYVCVDFYQSNKKIHECMELSSDLLLNTKFDQKFLDNEINVVLEEKNRYFQANKRKLHFNHTIFMKSKYKSLKEETDRIFGEDDFLKNLKTQDLIDFRDKHFVKEKFVFTIVTSLSFSKVKKLVEKYFIKNLKTNNEKMEYVSPDLSLIDEPSGVNIVKNEDKNINCVISLTANTPGSPYSTDSSLNCVVSAINRNKNLFYNKARDKGLIYTCGADYSLNNGADNMPFYFGFTTSKHENIDKLIEIINQTIKTLKSEGIEQKDIDIYKENYFIRKDTKMPRAYSDQGRDLVYDYIYDEKFYTTKQIDKRVKSITKEKVDKAINLFFDKNNPIHITFLGDIDSSKIKSIDEYRNMLFD